MSFLLFFINDTATTEIYTYCHAISRHDALPIFDRQHRPLRGFDAERAEIGAVEHLEPVGRHDDLNAADAEAHRGPHRRLHPLEHRPFVDEVAVDRKSTRLNSSH